MTAPILYCGDTSLESAASYLAGLMTHFGLEFDYVPSDEKISEGLVARPHSLLILSDYPAAQFHVELQQQVVQQVQQGMGLLMIGGWESFHGFGGNWDGTPIGSTLPVEISGSDDRVNFAQPALLHPTDWTEELWGLPWFLCPPSVGGINRFKPKSDSQVLLSVSPFRPYYNVVVKAIRWQSDSSAAALVTGKSGQGRTAAFATDVAPHWVGGFVDWGPSRVTAQAPGAGAIEVGSDYASFWRRLLSWTARLE